MRTSTYMYMPLLVTVLVLLAGYAAASLELASETKALDTVPRDRRLLRANAEEEVDSTEAQNEERGITAKVGSLIKDWKIKQMFKNGKTFDEIFSKGVTSYDVWQAFKIAKLQGKISLTDLQFNLKYANWYHYDAWYARKITQ